MSHLLRARELSNLVGIEYPSSRSGCRVAWLLLVLLIRILVWVGCTALLLLLDDGKHEVLFLRNLFLLLHGFELALLHKVDIVKLISFPADDLIPNSLHSFYWVKEELSQGILSPPLEEGNALQEFNVVIQRLLHSLRDSLVKWLFVQRCKVAVSETKDSGSSRLVLN